MKINWNWKWRGLVNESILWEKVISLWLSWTEQRLRWVWFFFINVHGVKHTGGKKLFVLKNCGDTRRNWYKMHKFRFEIRTFRDVRFWESLSVKARREKNIVSIWSMQSDACYCRELTWLPKISSSPMFFYNTTNCCILSYKYIQ